MSGDDDVGSSRKTSLGERGMGQQGGRDDQRLGDRGVGDLFSGRGGAQPGQIQPTDLRPAADAIGSAGEIQPLGKHAGSLGALSGRKQRDHISKRTL